VSVKHPSKEQKTAIEFFTPKFTKNRPVLARIWHAF